MAKWRVVEKVGFVHYVEAGSRKEAIEKAEHEGELERNLVHYGWVAKKERGEEG